MGSPGSAAREEIPWRDLFKVAAKARQRAYAPYSGFRVGAAVLTAEGSILGGCNVENASYGLSLCAERNAICSAVTSVGGARIKAVAILAASRKPCFPCGMCLQVISEFGYSHLPVRSRTVRGKEASYRLDELLPKAFSAASFRAAQVRAKGAVRRRSLC